MKALVDRLSAELSNRYVDYLAEFTVGLWSDAGYIEFRCSFTLLYDQKLRTFTLKVPALSGETDDERKLLIVVVFEQIEDRIDNAVASVVGMN